MNNRKIFVALVALCCMFASLAAVSTARQNSNSNTGAQTNSNKSGNMNMGGQTNSGNMMARSGDGKFMMTAAQAGMAEVETGRVALQNASSASVRQFAQQMIDDHTAANAELMQLASAKGITLPTAPDAKHQAMMARLQQLTGAAFDREYIKNAGVKDHQAVLKLFQSEASKGKDADAKAFAAKNVPVIQGHLNMAQQLNGSMTGGSNTNTNSNRNSNSNSNMNMR